MNNGKVKWTIKVNGTPQKFEGECYPPNDSKRRYVLKVYPKDKIQTKKEIFVIMLNPSTADENEPDQTCKFLINQCNWNGHNSITICNLFSSRGLIEKLNECMENDTANDNSSDEKLKEQIKKFDEILCAWGGPYKGIKNKKVLNDRIKEVFKILESQKLRGKKILKLKKDSENRCSQYPPHPLGKAHHTEFEPYCIEEINIEG